MKIINLLVFFYLLFTLQTLDAQSFDWIQDISGERLKNIESITTDEVGNIYILGNIYGLTEFDSNAISLTPTGIIDMYFAKFDQHGKFIWVKQVGASLLVKGYTIKVNSEGNLIISGTARGSVDFDPNPSTAHIVNSTSLIFALKLNSEGEFIWVKYIEGEINESPEMILDDSDNIYMRGYVRSGTDMNPDPEISNNLFGGALHNIYISKWDDSGNYQWANYISPTEQNHTHTGAIAIDTEGNVYNMGYFENVVDFDVSTGGISTLSSSGSWDIVISKYTEDGDFIWAKQIGGPGRDRGTSFFVHDDKLYLSGSFSNSADIDPSPNNTFELHSSGGTDLFFACMDLDGELIWARQLASTDDTNGIMAINKQNEILLYGTFKGEIDIDPSPLLSETLFSQSATDLYLVTFDIEGQFKSAFNFGGENNQSHQVFEVDGFGNVYMSGKYQTSASFQTEEGFVPLSSLGSDDNFILKLASAAPSCSYELIDFEDFEEGWGLWNDGGGDCMRDDNDYAENLVVDGVLTGGDYNVRLRDNSSGSDMYTDDIDLSSYEEIQLTFTFVTESMELEEDFFLELSPDGDTDDYLEIGHWISGVDFENGTYYTVEVTFNDKTQFTDETRLRFRCDASSNGDKVFIDYVRIAGCKSMVAMNLVESNSENDLITQYHQNSRVDELELFPNPSQGELNLKLKSEEDISSNQIIIFNEAGHVVRYFENIDLDVPIKLFDLDPGLYLLLLSNDAYKSSQTFIITR